jgi:hypothetical protein
MKAGDSWQEYVYEKLYFTQRAGLKMADADKVDLVLEGLTPSLGDKAMMVISKNVRELHDWEFE